MKNKVWSYAGPEESMLKLMFFIFLTRNGTVEKGKVAVIYLFISSVTMT
jgi:hypothetical protein